MIEKAQEEVKMFHQNENDFIWKVTLKKNSYGSSDVAIDVLIESNPLKIIYDAMGIYLLQSFFKLSEPIHIKPLDLNNKIDF